MNSRQLKNKTVMNEDYKKFVSFIITSVVVLAFIGGLFFLSAKYVNKDLFQKDEQTTTKEATYDKTLLIVDDILKQAGEYYVLVYDSKDDTSVAFYQDLISSYKADDMSLYSVDLANKMNSSYYNTSEDESIKAGEFNFTRPVLITVKNSKITTSTSDIEEIANKLTKK